MGAWDGEINLYLALPPGHRMGAQDGAVRPHPRTDVCTILNHPGLVIGRITGLGAPARPGKGPTGSATYSRVVAIAVLTVRANLCTREGLPSSAQYTLI